MEVWKEYKLGDICQTNKEQYSKKDNFSNVIKIPKRNQISQPDGSIILKNKYNFVDLINYTAYKDYGYNTLIKSIDVENFEETLGKSTYTETSDVIVRMDTYYTSGSFDVPKFQNYKLNVVIKVSDNEYTNNYSDNFYYNPSRYVNDYNKFESLLRDTNTPLNFDDLYKISPYDSTYEITGKDNLFNIEEGEVKSYFKIYTDYYKNLRSIIFKMSNVSTSQSDNTSFEVIENENSYTINYKVLSGLFVATSITPSGVSDYYFYYSDRKSKSFEISVYGDIEETKFSEYSETPNKDEGNIVSASINSNNLIETNTKIGEQSIYQYIKENILSDYANGISTISLSISCMDYYNINGEKSKNWASGEIFEVGDFVRIDKDNEGNSAFKYSDGTNMYFKVTGRRFRKIGVPLIDLELQEVKVID